MWHKSNACAERAEAKVDKAATLASNRRHKLDALLQKVAKMKSLVAAAEENHAICNDEYHIAVRDVRTSTKKLGALRRDVHGLGKFVAGAAGPNVDVFRTYPGLEWETADVSSWLNTAISTELSLAILEQDINTVTALIDQEKGILRLEQDRISWITCPITINDRDGIPVPVDFGRFEIDVWLNNEGVLKITAAALEPAWDNREGRFFHPHLSSVADRSIEWMRNNPVSVCLGNAQEMLVVALSGSRLAECVIIVHNFLSSYNHADPYLSMAAWAPTKWTHPNCECGVVLITQCGCTRCLDCDALLPNFAHPPSPDREVHNVCSGCAASLYERNADGKFGANGTDLVPTCVMNSFNITPIP